MDKDDIIEDFFKSLKVALNNTAIYFKEHPLFLKSVENLKEKIDFLFSFSPVFRMGIAPHSLFVDGKYWEARLHEDLADIFHHRQIKNIEITQGVSVEELVFFLTNITMSAKDILKAGGAGNILNKGSINHISVEELDYSQLLRDSEGQDFKDVWSYLLAGAVDKADTAEINDFVNNFGKTVSKFRQNDFLENDDLRANISSFFIYLKNKDKPKFIKCARELIKAILKDRSGLSQEKIDKFKLFFKDLSSDDFVDTLLEEISTDDNFDSLSFKLFSRLMDEEKQKRVADALADKNVLSRGPRVRKKIRELLSGSTEDLVSQVYRHTLSTLLKDIHFEDEVFFDQKTLFKNYILTVINLLSEEKDKKKIALILERITKDWGKIIEEGGTEYLKSLLVIMELRKKEDPSYEYVFAEVETYLGEFAERQIMEGKDIHGAFFNVLKTSFFNAEVYFDKIFRENKITPCVFRLFFKFFPGELIPFYGRLKLRCDDVGFLKNTIDALKKVDSIFSLTTLKEIYSFPNNFIRVEILKAMRELFELSIYDETFLFSVLKEGNIFFKREVLPILISKNDTKKKAVEMLFSKPGLRFGANRILEENITLTAELDIKDAHEHLVLLSKKRFFWNKRIRDLAGSVLKKL